MASCGGIGVSAGFGRTLPVEGEVSKVQPCHQERPVSFYPASASDATATGTQGGGPGGDHDAGLDGGGSAAAALAGGGAVQPAVRVEPLFWPLPDPHRATTRESGGSG